MQICSFGFVLIILNWLGFFFFFQEYIVEDREVNKDVAELDPSHVTELRMLGLY